MKTSSLPALVLTFASLALPCSAQVNSGSDGHDGAFNPTTSTVINMTDHPDGIYHYTSVNIPTGVTVFFTPNANNTPVVWLVQTDIIIGGSINLDGKSSFAGGVGGPGGFVGGNGGLGLPGGGGLGPGGGVASTQHGSYGTGYWGGNGSYATMGGVGSVYMVNSQAAAGNTYGNIFILPLIGGSGGAGSSSECGAGGAGGLLIAASGTITLSGTISANGGSGTQNCGGGGGSGGSVRLVAATLTGGGSISTMGGSSPYYDSPFNYWSPAGKGRIRLDSLVNTLSGYGQFQGDVSSGFQPIIIPAPTQQTHLAISSIAGISVPSNSPGTLLNPAVIIPGQQVNPIPVVVQCSNIPLNTAITVEVHPAIGATVTAVGINNAGTETSSTATIPVNMPRGGGVILATAVTPITFASNDKGEKSRSLAETGWTADGETFAKMELTVAPGGRQRIVYLTESGKRYPLSQL
jgi:hypothetical protein